MLRHGFKTSTTPGTAVALSTGSKPFAWATFFPRKVGSTQNTGEVRIGGLPSDPESTAYTGSLKAIPQGSGMPLQPGDAGVAWPVYAQAGDLNSIYLDVDNSGDGVQFVYFRP